MWWYGTTTLKGPTTTSLQFINCHFMTLCLWFHDHVWWVEMRCGCSLRVLPDVSHIGVMWLDSGLPLLRCLFHPGMGLVCIVYYSCFCQLPPLFSSFVSLGGAFSLRNLIKANAGSFLFSMFALLLAYCIIFLYSYICQFHLTTAFVITYFTLDHSQNFSLWSNKDLFSLCHTQ